MITRHRCRPNSILAIGLTVLIIGAAHSANRPANDRLRVIVETDAGGDPDDEQSMVRFLLYTNEWDVLGIIANRAVTREGENLNTEKTGLGVVRRMVKAYGGCYPKLSQHDARYPKPEALLERTVPGDPDRDDGVRLILAALAKDDPRPIWFTDWGSEMDGKKISMYRALDELLTRDSGASYAAAKNRLRIVCNGNPLGEHLNKHKPQFKLWVDTFQPPMDRLRWYHRFSAITATAGGFDIERDVRSGHGPLGALYPLNTTHKQKEGDTMAFLYLVPTGMNDPSEPTWGSWAGRYGLRPEAPAANMHWANQADSWRKTLHRENTVRRWAVDLQNDFRTRMEWCVRDFKEANHPPRVILNGDKTTNVFRLTAAPGETVRLDAAGTSDPDGDKVTYEWFVYAEAGTYPGQAAVSDMDTNATTLKVPGDAAGKTIHVVLTVRDDRPVALARYRRAVVRVK